MEFAANAYEIALYVAIGLLFGFCFGMMIAVRERADRIADIETSMRRRDRIADLERSLAGSGTAARRSTILSASLGISTVLALVATTIALPRDGTVRRRD